MSFGVEAAECKGRSPTSYSNKICRCENCRELFKEYARGMHRKHRERRVVRNRDYYKKHSVRLLEQDYVKRYGLTFAERDMMVDVQGGVCAICAKPPNLTAALVRDRQLHTDHCHQTGKVRGMLCTACNKAIGLLKENPEALRRAIKYLEIGAKSCRSDLSSSSS